METAEIRELISVFVPEEILRDFKPREVEKGAGEDTPQATPRDRRSLQILPEDPEVARADPTAQQRPKIQDEGG